MFLLPGPRGSGHAIPARLRPAERVSCSHPAALCNKNGKQMCGVGSRGARAHCRCGKSCLIRTPVPSPQAHPASCSLPRPHNSTGWVKAESGSEEKHGRASQGLLFWFLPRSTGTAGPYESQPLPSRCSRLEGTEMGEQVVSVQQDQCPGRASPERLGTLLGRTAGQPQTPGTVFV